MPEKTLVFAAVPSSTRAKLVSGAGLAVNGNDVDPFGVASLMIVMEPGNVTASAERERSCFPPLPSRSIKLVWYGDPLIETAELVNPQSRLVAICPLQA